MTVGATDPSITVVNATLLQFGIPFLVHIILNIFFVGGKICERHVVTLT